MHTIRVNDRFESATVKPFRGGGYQCPMLWVLIHSNSREVIKRLVIPASVIAHPIMHNQVRYELM